jgi:hypothetical protein
VGVCRCNRAITLFDINEGTLTFLKESVYQSDNEIKLSRERPAELFQNFESWRMGPMGFQSDQVRLGACPASLNHSRHRTAYASYHGAPRCRACARRRCWQACRS